MALDLTKYGITGSTVIAHNPSYEELYKAEINPALEGYEKGKETELGAVNVMTGIFTGRSPKDKSIVDHDESHNNVGWTSEDYKKVNHH
ncbi:MAG: phosphoenolpyruvate carboxykinase (ATP), partial [Bacteroidaceae bacterium]|nr:phosphoenolpyruvate carboxykinase (ATP) [Bacteroidaceae bacterium]